MPFGQGNFAGRNLLGPIAFKHRGIKPVFWNAIHVRQQFPAPCYGLSLEIIAKAPVAQHFEHGVVVVVYTHFFQIVVFATNAQAFLRVGRTGVWGSLVAQKVVLKLVHARIGKQQCGVVFYHNGSARHDGVALLGKKI